MTYPEFLRSTILTGNSSQRLSAQDKTDLYIDFLNWYLNSGMFIQVRDDENKPWFKLSRKHVLVGKELTYIKDLASQTGWWFPPVASDEAKEGFIDEFVKTTFKHFPIYENGKLAKKANELLDSKPEYSFTVPQWNNEPIPNYLVAIMKHLEKQPIIVTSLDFGGIVSIIHDNAKGDKRYSYLPAGESRLDYGRDMALYPNLTEKKFYSSIGLFVSKTPLTLLKRAKYGKLGQTVRNKKISIPSVSALTVAGSSAAILEPAIFMGGSITAGFLTAIGATIYALTSHYAASLVSLTPEGRMRLREIKAWENYVDNTGNKNSYRSLENANPNN